MRARKLQYRRWENHDILRKHQARQLVCRGLLYRLPRVTGRCGEVAPSFTRVTKAVKGASGCGARRGLAC